MTGEQCLGTISLYTISLLGGLRPWSLVGKSEKEQRRGLGGGWQTVLGKHMYIRMYRRGEDGGGGLEGLAGTCSPREGYMHMRMYSGTYIGLLHRLIGTLQLKSNVIAAVVNVAVSLKPFNMGEEVLSVRDATLDIGMYSETYYRVTL